MRLIDADTLEKSFFDECKLHKCDRWDISAIITQINDAPTITPPPNPPLTLEELREMDGEPVWTESHIFPEDCGWRVIRKAGIISVEFTDGRHFSLTDYDKSWLAYRRKPEEGTT